MLGKIGEQQDRRGILVLGHQHQRGIGCAVQQRGERRALGSAQQRPRLGAKSRRPHSAAAGAACAAEALRGNNQAVTKVPAASTASNANKPTKPRGWGGCNATRWRSWEDAPNVPT